MDLKTFVLEPHAQKRDYLEDGILNFDENYYTFQLIGKKSPVCARHIMYKFYFTISTYLLEILQYI